MRYLYDHDLHIHSHLSLCSPDEKQTPESILEYARKNFLKQICITNHFWDEKVPGASGWYEPQNFAHISKSRPLPKEEGIEFLFGCETEMDRFLRIGISEERLNEFDFIIVPTTHMHMVGYTIDEEDNIPDKKARLWVKRFEALLDMDLPFHKMGVAHLTTPGICVTPRSDYLKTLSLIDEEAMVRLFQKAAKVGIGIELNSSDMGFSDDEADIVLRPYRIAKACGCKFYLGSDAHDRKRFDGLGEIFERAIDLLNLDENDKFVIKK